ncbi:uncharacterized protein [Triticum aestivum]|uniref:uncharacterized protein n=1 Tax=Triticum aestivum TaxID=4565 RepID=UPI001D006002|nr:uncharacterized protein LOC123067923 [Triticum aestivum]
MATRQGRRPVRKGAGQGDGDDGGRPGRAARIGAGRRAATAPSEGTSDGDLGRLGEATATSGQGPASRSSSSLAAFERRMAGGGKFPKYLPVNGRPCLFSSPFPPFRKGREEEEALERRRGRGDFSLVHGGGEIPLSSSLRVLPDSLGCPGDDEEFDEALYNFYVNNKVKYLKRKLSSAGRNVFKARVDNFLILCVCVVIYSMKLTLPFLRSISSSHILVKRF